MRATLLKFHSSVAAAIDTAVDDGITIGEAASALLAMAAAMPPPDDRQCESLLDLTRLWLRFARAAQTDLPGSAPLPAEVAA